MDFPQQLTDALKAAKKASKKILEYYYKGFNVKFKADKSEVTSADLASEKIIKETLTKAYPDYGMLSEESVDDKTRLEKDFCWIVDPLDGTRDFVSKTGNFAVNIALAYKHEIVLGVIAVPSKDIIYYATKGNGAYKIENGKETRIHVSNKKEEIRLAISQFFFKNVDKYNQDLNIIELIPMGSSYKAGLISEGKAELCIKEDHHTKEWDTAPSDIIIKEAGGIMKTAYGKDMSYNKNDVINHDGFIITNCLETLNKYKKS
jgi:3'(2'), 5'-bisphosphate nucleotidase